MSRFLILAGIYSFVPCMAFAVAQQVLPTAPNTIVNEQEIHHTLTLKLYERQGGTIKLLADPTIKAIDEKPFSFIAGGEIKDILPAIEYGTCVNGTVSKHANGHVWVVLKISIGNPVRLDDANITVVKSQSIDVRMELVRSATKTIQIDDVTWFDVRID